MIHLTPGLDYLLRFSVTKLIIPPATVYGCYSLLGPFKVAQWIPSWLRSTSGLCLVTIGSIVLRTTVASLWTTFRRRRAMRRLHAQPLPRIQGGKWPGNLDLVISFTKKYRDKEYAGEGFDDLVAVNSELFVFNLAWDEAVWMASPHYVKEILTTQFPNFVKGKVVHAILDDFLGSGIFNSDGETWKFHRVMTRPFFNRDRVTDFEIFHRHTEALLIKIQERVKTGVPFDFQEAISQFSMDSATEFLFGNCVHSLATPFSLPGGQRVPNGDLSTTNLTHFSDFFQKLGRMMGLRGQSNYPWQLNEIFDDSVRTEMKVIREYISPMIDVAIEKAKALKERSPVIQSKHLPKGSETEGEDLLTYLASQTHDRTIIQDELLNILLAGRDTTASCLTFLVYFLAMHPDVMQRLRQEIFEVVPPSLQPDTEHIRNMKYLRAVINETLRLMPPVPFEIKESVNDTVVTNPETGVRHYIPGGTKVVFSPMWMQRSTTYWGPDALQFDPDRWLDDRNQKYYLANPFIFIPFLAGPRICLGQQFAYNEISFFIIRFLQKFEHIELAPDAHPPNTLPLPSWKQDLGWRKPVERVWPKNHLTLYSFGGMWVRLR